MPNLPGHWRRLVLLPLALCLGGCASPLWETLRLKNTVLVKIPTNRKTPQCAGGAWQFRHVLEAPKGPWRDGQWYVAWNTAHPLSSSPFSPYWFSIYRRAPEIADATFAAFRAYPILIEPNRTFGRLAVKRSDGPRSPIPIAPGAPHQLWVTKRPKAAWPAGRTEDGKIDPLWHLDERHSQLAEARKMAGVPAERDRIRIGHLDNGYDAAQSGLPRHMFADVPEANIVGLLARAQGVNADDRSPGATRSPHGTGTLGLLAGGRIKLHDPKNRVGSPDDGTSGIDLGGAPEAKVVSIRVAPWVASFNTAELASAIDYASRKKGCDVISMSHGGAPTQAWVDAVNAAYERGTAIFAAEGNFISVAGWPIKPRGIFLPSSPVYPAAFGRVIGVTGATAEEKSYAKQNYWSLLRAPWTLPQWAFRGGYGADGTSSVIYRPNRKPDPVQTADLGTLRPYPIAGYAPNVAWLAARKNGSAATADALELDGGGTSSATPQVAAAAALWLQKHRRDFHGDDAAWHSWRKVEAVYYALLKTADRSKKGAPDDYLGLGSVKAKDALAIDYATAQRATKPAGLGQSPPGSLYFGQARPDEFYGGSSLRGFFGLQSFWHVEQDERAQLWQETDGRESREMALTRLYFNLGLLREWHGGDTPRKSDQATYWQRAQRWAAKADR